MWGASTRFWKAAEAAFKATVDLAQAGHQWVYTGLFQLTSANGRWRVHWAPSVIHPDLGAGDRLAVVSETGEPIGEERTLALEGFHGARAERISVHSLLRSRRAEAELEGERAFRLARGYGELLRVMRESLVCAQRGLPSFSASAVMLRNLTTWNGWLLRPTRSCR